ncbi:MAG: DUF3592 domain-containing protein [Chitinophagaceae bacterium]
MTFLLLITIGCIMIAVSLLNSDTDKALIKTGKYAEGIIFEQDVNTDTSSYANTNPVVRFTTEDKTWITGRIKQNISVSYTGQYKDGEKVAVYYDPEDPSRFYVASKQSPTIARILMLVIGLSLVTYGIYQFITE